MVRGMVRGIHGPESSRRIALSAESLGFPRRARMLRAGRGGAPGGRWSGIRKRLTTVRTIPLYRLLEESTASLSVTASSSSGVNGKHRSPSGPLVDASHRYFLPVVSGLCIFLGGVLLFRGPESLGKYPPLAILALGTGCLVSSLAYLGWKHPKVDPPLAMARAPVLDIGPALCSECSAPIPPSLGWEDLFYGRYEVPARGDGTATALRVLFTPTSAADQLWIHWLPTEVGQFPSELIGPIPESSVLSSRARPLYRTGRA